MRFLARMTLCMIVMLGGTPSVWSQEPQLPSPVASPLGQAQQYARSIGIPEKVIAALPSITRIFVNTFMLSEPFNNEGVGSAVFVERSVDGTGLFVTAAHMFEPYKEIICGDRMTVTIHIPSLKDFPAKVVYNDTANDIAVVRVKLGADFFPAPVPIAQKDPNIGDEMYAVGFLGLYEDFETPVTVRFRGTRHSMATSFVHGFQFSRVVTEFIIVPGIEEGYSGGGLLNKEGELDGTLVRVSPHGFFSYVVARAHLLEALETVHRGQEFCAP